MSLNMGGDDITEFLYVLLERIDFPYRDINLSKWHDWNVMEDLKARLCTLAEVETQQIYSQAKLLTRIYSPSGRCGTQSVRFCGSPTRQTYPKVWATSLRRNHSGTHGQYIRVSLIGNLCRLRIFSASSSLELSNSIENELVYIQPATRMSWRKSWNTPLIML